MSQSTQRMRDFLLHAIRETLEAIGPAETLQVLDSGIDFIGRTPRESLSEDELPPTLKSIPCAAPVGDVELCG